jgi:hypothetical protein
MKKLRDHPNKVFGEHNDSLNDSFEGWTWKDKERKRHEDRD